MSVFSLTFMNVVNALLILLSSFAQIVLSAFNMIGLPKMLDFGGNAEYNENVTIRDLFRDIRGMLDTLERMVIQ